jgi:hypothetical protein
MTMTLDTGTGFTLTRSTMLERIWILGVRLSLFLVFLPSLVLSQKFTTGTVVEKRSRQPIYLANVYFFDYLGKQTWGTVTDNDGNFHLSVPDDFANDTLRFTHLGYKNIFIKVDSLKTSLSLFIELEEDVKNLQAVTISALTPKQYILECIKKRQVNYFDVVFWEKAFYCNGLKKIILFGRRGSKKKSLDEYKPITDESLGTRRLNSVTI